MRSNIARTWPASSVPGALSATTSGLDRKSTTAVNCFGGSRCRRTTASAAVGLTSVRAIACGGQARADVRQLRARAVVAVVADLVAGLAAGLGDDRAAEVELGERRLALPRRPPPAP